MGRSNYEQLQENLLEIIEKNPGIKRDEIVRRVRRNGISKNSICTVLYVLKRNDLVQGQRAGRSTERFFIKGEAPTHLLSSLQEEVLKIVKDNPQGITYERIRKRNLVRRNLWAVVNALKKKSLVSTKSVYLPRQGRRRTLVYPRTISCDPEPTRLAAKRLAANEMPLSEEEIDFLEKLEKILEARQQKQQKKFESGEEMKAIVGGAQGRTQSIIGSIEKKCGKSIHCIIEELFEGA